MRVVPSWHDSCPNKRDLAAPSPFLARERGQHEKAQLRTKKETLT